MKATTKGIAILAVVFALATTAHAGQGLGSAQVHSIDGSRIKGHILLLDSGDPATGLVVSGRATGLDPQQAYVTLLYDDDSVPSGPQACVPTGGLNGNQMFVGFWSVDQEGNGSLFSVKTGDAYAALTDVGTVSIRGGAFDLQGCGRVSDQR